MPFGTPGFEIRQQCCDLHDSTRTRREIDAVGEAAHENEPHLLCLVVTVGDNR